MCLKLRTSPSHRMRLLLLSNLNVRNGWANGTRVRLKMCSSWTAPHRKMNKHVQRATKTPEPVETWSFYLRD